MNGPNPTAHEYLSFPCLLVPKNELKKFKTDLRSGLKTLDKLEGRVVKAEGRLKELKETLPAGLKGLRMSLDGVRKYYGVQRRLIEQRLVALEAGFEGDGDQGACR